MKEIRAQIEELIEIERTIAGRITQNHKTWMMKVAETLALIADGLDSIAEEMSTGGPEPGDDPELDAVVAELDEAGFEYDVVYPSAIAEDASTSGYAIPKPLEEASMDDPDGQPYIPQSQPQAGQAWLDKQGADEELYPPNATEEEETR